ncbi:MAG: IS200/IS605 family transposase [Ignavibacteria bacterium]|nr:IS200/IS605 family transposase [Ignavibacteria bacterium]
MANTYSQIYIQFVFAVKGRQYLVRKDIKAEIHKYITGIVKNKEQKLLAINCMPDHTHLFIGMNPDIHISNLVRDIKANSSRFINDKKLIKGKFSWQEGFGAFSYSHSHLDRVVKYVLNQEDHHKKRTFKEEYIDLLEKFNIEYNPKYVFEFYDN